MGIVSYNMGASNRITVSPPVSSSPPTPPQQEAPEDSKKPGGTSTVVLPPTPPGIDPVTGRPIVNPNSPETTTVTPESQKPIEYGTSSKRQTSKNYTYEGKVPAGAEGKVQFFYNVLDYPDIPGKYFVEMKIVNISNGMIEEIETKNFQRGGDGKVIYAGEGMRWSELAGTLGPGKSIDGAGVGGVINQELVPPVTVFTEVTYVKFGGTQ